MSKKDKKQNGGQPAAEDQDGAEVIEIVPEAGAAEPEQADAAPGEDAPGETEAAKPKPAAAEEDSGEEESYDVPKVRDLAEAKCALEALLFASIEPLSLKKLSGLLPPLDPHTIRNLVVELQGDLDAGRRGLQIVEVGRGFQMATRPEYGKWIVGLMPHRRKSSLSTAALETLSIIAYKQPLTRVEVDQIRGVDSSGTVRNLLDLGLIREVGKKEVAGRPNLYQTTDQFLKVFGLRRLTDLPALQELRRRFVTTAEPMPGEAARGDDEDGEAENAEQPESIGEPEPETTNESEDTEMQDDNEENKD